ncbi:hypothetical protein CBS101457_003989 [Exobasidium rhododendri]|nr:hypothetical protein CBS101457_003989 [Exobasidium rhododendri]
MARHDDDEHSSRRKRYDDGSYSSGQRPRDSYSSSSRRHSPTRSRSPDLDRHRRRRDHTETSSSSIASSHRHRSSRGGEDDWRRRDDAERDRLRQVRRREFSNVDSHRYGERRMSGQAAGNDDTRLPSESQKKRSRSRSPIPTSAGHLPDTSVSEVKESVKNGSSSPAPAVDKLRSKKEKLEAWRRERERKALEEANHKEVETENPKSNGMSSNADGPTTIKASGLKGLASLARPDFSKDKQKNVSAMDDVGDQPKQQIERFILPPMSGDPLESMASVEADEEDDDEAVGLVDDEEVHGNREDVTATLQAKRKAAAEAEEEKMLLDTKVEEVDEDEELDPLDAFMAGVTTEVKQVNEADRQRVGKGKQRALAEVVGGFNQDDGIGEEAQKTEADELDQAEVQDLMALAASKIKKKDMPVVDHESVKYEPFRKSFYHPPAEVEEMTEEDAERLRMELDAIKVRGKDCPKPLTKWSYCGLPGTCLDVIHKLGYKSPTAIQAQAIPAIMSGRDIIGVAKTGSGKTMAFLLPMFRHIKDQRKVASLEGPIGLIMTPTRELAVQIFRESKPFVKALGLRAVCVYGGAPISEQIAEMKKTAEIVVATPGRMIDLLTANSGRVTNLKRVTYLVLDEADRMFDMGFEPQVMKIVNNIRPDRQTVLFSATFPKQMESLARKVLKNQPVEITVGGRSVVAEEIEQIVEVREENSKFHRLLEILGRTYMDDEDCRTLIFVERQEAADDLLKELMKKGYPTMSLHGGKDQVDRDSTISDFKAGVVPIVTATSVAARGLDVKQLKLVINYDTPNHMEDYVHRAGRTGRAGNKGTCITFITPEQDRYARDIISALKASKRPIPADLEELAVKFREKLQSGKAHAISSGFGGKGLERFESDREKALAAQKSSFGEGVVNEEQQSVTAKAEGMMDDVKVSKGPVVESEEMRQVSELRIEVKKGLAPESVRDNRVKAAEDGSQASVKKEQEEEADNALLARNAKMLEAARARGVDTTKLAQALANINAAAQNRKAQRMSEEDSNRKGKDPDATDYHAIVPINDFPQRARWRVTNKETMTNLIQESGASITNKGIFYEKGKEPQPGEPPKLQLLVESNDESKVEAAVREIKQLLLEATQAAMEAEQRNPGGAPGRYSVL